jgi:hypothetical protein
MYSKNTCPNLFCHIFVFICDFMEKNHCQLIGTMLAHTLSSTLVCYLVFIRSKYIKIFYKPSKVSPILNLTIRQDGRTRLYGQPWLAIKAERNEPRNAEKRAHRSKYLDFGVRTRECAMQKVRV